MEQAQAPRREGFTMETLHDALRDEVGERPRKETIENAYATKARRESGRGSSVLTNWKISPCEEFQDQHPAGYHIRPVKSGMSSA